MMEMEPEKVNVRRGLSADTSSYRCATCHGDEDALMGHPIRGRAKSRSLSASPALASTKEFRYDGPPRPSTSQLHAHTRSALPSSVLSGARACAHGGVWPRPRSRLGWRGRSSHRAVGPVSLPPPPAGVLLLHKTLSHSVQSGVRPAGQAR